MKDQVEVPSSTPPHWKIAALGEVATVVNGGTPKSKVAEYWDGDVQWLTPKDMGQMDAREISATPRTISKIGLAKSSARLVPPQSVILSTRAPIGHLAINSVPMAFNQGCRGIVPEKRLDHVFLYYFLAANRQKLDDLGSGTTFKELSATNLRAVELPLPPLEEQKRIVAVLDQAFAALDRAHAHAEANLADAGELFPSVLSRAFDPDEPWELCSVADLVARGILERPIDGNHGETHPKKADFVESGVPFIMASDLNDGVVDQSGCYFLNRKQADGLRKGFAKDGDVLLSHKGTIGRAAVLDTELDYVMLTPQVTYYRVINTELLDRDFLYFCMRSSAFQKQMIEIARAGATRAYIGITRQLDLPIPLPKADVQRKLVRRFREIEGKSWELVDGYSARISNIAALRQSRLNQAFAGRLS